jgi:hypothetical protein
LGAFEIKKDSNFCEQKTRICENLFLKTEHLEFEKIDIFNPKKKFFSRKAKHSFLKYSISVTF